MNVAAVLGHKPGLISARRQLHSPIHRVATNWSEDLLGDVEQAAEEKGSGEKALVGS